MVNLLTRGLAPAVRLKIEDTGVIDFTHLKLEDVTRFIPRGEVEVDWQSLLFIKNNRPADTIVLTLYDGFFRTPLSPRELVDLAIASTDKTWHDHNTNVDILHLSGPTPVVSGNLQLLVTEQPARRNHTSWVGVQSIERVNAASEKKVRVQLKNGMEMIFRDRAVRLRKKMAEAQRIKYYLIREHEDLRRHFAPDEGAAQIVDDFDGHESRLQRSVRLVSACFTMCNHPLSPEHVRKVILNVQQGRREVFNFEDEHY